MKIEGMQYPLPVRPTGPRSEHTHNEVDVSDDAVYFEPDERREQKKKHSPQEQPKPEHPLEEQIVLDSVAASSDSNHTVVTDPKSKEAVRPPLNITA